MSLEGWQQLVANERQCLTPDRLANMICRRPASEWSVPCRRLGRFLRQAINVGHCTVEHDARVTNARAVTCHQIGLNITDRIGYGFQPRQITLCRRIILEGSRVGEEYSREVETGWKQRRSKVSVHVVETTDFKEFPLQKTKSGSILCAQLVASNSAEFLKHMAGFGKTPVMIACGFAEQHGIVRDFPGQRSGQWPLAALELPEAIRQLGQCVSLFFE